MATRKKITKKKITKKVGKETRTKTKVTKKQTTSKSAIKKVGKKKASKKQSIAKKVKVKKQTTKKVAKKVAERAAAKVTTKTVKKVASKSTKTNSIKPATKPAIKKKVATKVSKKVAKKSTAPAENDNLIHGIEPYKEKAREKYMNPDQVDHFRNILVAWKTNLIDEVSRTIHLMQDENINHPDPNDRASQETDMSLELRNRDRERKLLKKIDQTIGRVDSDEYGWCDRCGIEIGIRRLEARPTAELCVDCKTLNEIKERQMI